MDEDYDILSYNYGTDGQEFISTVEHKILPIYGIQWHPEKNPYIWKTSSMWNEVPHFPDAIEATQAVANFLISEGIVYLNISVDLS